MLRIGRVSAGFGVCWDREGRERREKGGERLLGRCLWYGGRIGVERDCYKSVLGVGLSE